MHQNQQKPTHNNIIYSHLKEELERRRHAKLPVAAPRMDISDPARPKENHTTQQDFSYYTPLNTTAS
jgi:hypothetical protein